MNRYGTELQIHCRWFKLADIEGDSECACTALIAEY